MLGCGNDNINDFFKNPQFPISCKIENANDTKVSVIIFLMQIDSITRRSNSNGAYEDSNLSINMSVHRIDNASKTKRYNNEDLTEIFSGANYTNNRSISARLELDPADYLIIPSTFNKDDESKFILKVYIEGKSDQNAKKSTNDIKPNPIAPKPINDIKPNPIAPKPINDTKPNPIANDDDTMPKPDEFNKYEIQEQDNNYDDQINKAVDGNHEVNSESEEEEEERPVVSRVNKYNSGKNYMDSMGQVVSRACLIM